MNLTDGSFKQVEPLVPYLHAIGKSKRLACTLDSPSKGLRTSIDVSIGKQLRKRIVVRINQPLDSLLPPVQCQRKVFHCTVSIENGEREFPVLRLQFEGIVPRLCNKAQPLSLGEELLQCSHVRWLRLHGLIKHLLADPSAFRPGPVFTSAIRCLRWLYYDTRAFNTHYQSLDLNSTTENSRLNKHPGVVIAGQRVHRRLNEGEAEIEMCVELKKTTKLFDTISNPVSDNQE